jgi:uncharacterized protein (TIGR02145 family)
VSSPGCENYSPLRIITFYSMKMKAIFCFYLLLFITNLAVCQSVISDATSSNNPRFGFTENKGQIIDQNNKPNPAVLYLLNTPGMNVQLRKGGFSYDLYQECRKAECRNFYPEPRTQNPEPSIQHPASSIQVHRIDIDLLNANPHPTIETSGTLSDYLNYYTTGTPVEGVTGVRSFATITYKNIYPGIDLQFIAGNDNLFEYNFILQPGADINAIKLKVYGPEKIKKFREGLRCKTSLGDVDETIPVCYYNIDNSRVPVKGRFNKIAEHLYGFAIDKSIPAGAFLVIDPIPTRRWGTYYGGTGGSDVVKRSCATDENGDIVLAGLTGSTDNIATAGAYQVTLLGNMDAFIAKFATNGQRLWGTYYGGTNSDEAYSCAIDHNNNIIIVGITGSSNNIASPGAWQANLNGSSDGFIAKFTPAGQRIWGSYYGGNEGPPSNTDHIMSCTVDSTGNIYFAGNTNAPDHIASPGAHQTTLGGSIDLYLVKFSPDGQRLWGTYYGGTNWEQDAACSASKNGYIFLTGNTASSNNIATPGSWVPNFNNSPGFLAAFNPEGQRLWGTYYAGPMGDVLFGCTADTGISVYVYGVGNSPIIGTSGVFQPSKIGGGNGCLSKFSSSGAYLWGTFYGSGPVQIVNAAVDDSGFVFVTGQSNSQDSQIASPNGYLTVYRGVIYNDFLTKFDGIGHRIWGTYYGGTYDENASSVAVDKHDNIFLSGETYSGNHSENRPYCLRSALKNHIATPGSLQQDSLSYVSAFLVKFSDCYSPDTAAQIFGPAILCQNSTGIVFSIDPILSATSYQWCVTGDITITSGQNTTSITVDVGSTLAIDTISVYGINACDIGFPKVITRSVDKRPVPVLSGPDTTCAGIDNIFTTSGGKSNYQWTVSPGGTITLNGTITDSSCTVKWSTAGAHWVKVGYTDNTGCTSLSPTQFNVWVNPGLITSVSISSSANPVCTGTSVTFTASPVNEGSTPFYQWKVNGIDAGINNVSYTYTPVNGDIVLCQLTSSLTGCLSGNPATSNQIVMTVSVNQPVSITISPDVNPVCAGTSVTFTAHPLNEGTLPSYQWKVNGNPLGANLPTYTYIPLNGDGVTCTVNSNATCAVNNPATSPVVTMSVNPNLLVTVSIIASSNPFCAGSSVTFTATPNNGGTPPSYQWKVNGIGVGPDNQVYSYVPNNGDVVTCVLSSNIACPIGNPATSNAITMVVNTNLPAGVSITATPNPFCPGSSVTITATPSNGGPLPTYQWKVNGINTGTGSTYTFNPANGDSVRCIMTSNLSCVTGSPASSSKIILSGTLAPSVSFAACFDTITTINAKPIKLKGGIPLGGTYSGTGVNAGYFNPALAGTGTHTITYSYTNAALCTALAHTHIINYPLSIFNCGNALTDPRDNKVYQTVQIGSQCWLASNLNFGTTLSSAQDQRDNCVAEKYCYSDNPINCTNHGGLYQWDELMLFDETPANQGFCPPGWHIPTENEWNILFASYISSGFAGSPLKYSGYSGFNALLPGARFINKGWDFNGFATFFWSSNSHGSTKAWAHGMNDEDPSVSAYPSSRVNALSVRCLKD